MCSLEKTVDLIHTMRERERQRQRQTDRQHFLPLGVAYTTGFSHNPFT